MNLLAPPSPRAPLPYPLISLGPDDVHLWLAFPDEPVLHEPSLLQTFEELMSKEERAQQRRFILARHRHQYLVARAVVRTLLSRYAAVAPAAWAFSTNEHGRPEIAAPRYAGGRLRFNLSHTEGLIVFAVVRQRQVGVDAEDSLRRVSDLCIADRFFSPREVEDLHALPEGDRRRRFFDYWTLKESYIKARGMGLALPLRRFSFHLLERAPLRLSCEPELADDPAVWRFALLRPTVRHTVALAVKAASRRGPPRRLRVQLRRVVPLVGEAPVSCEVAASTEQPLRPGKMAPGGSPGQAILDAL